MTEQEVHDDFELLDKEDEEQILAELRGGAIPTDKFIYKNKRGEWDLSYAGAKWVVRKMAEDGEAIRVDGHPKVERDVIDPEYITVTILGKRVKVDREAKSEIVLDTTVGAARGWIKQQLKEGGTIIPDPFFFNKTISKATRNLQLSLIPQDFKRKMVDALLRKKPSGGNGDGPSQGEHPAQQRQQSPPIQSGQKNQTAQQAQGQPQRPPDQTNSPSQGPKGQEAPLETLQQHFFAVFQQFSGVNDKPTLQKILKVLTGKESVLALDRAVMTELGPFLRLKVQGKAKWTGAAIQDMAGKQLWPKGAPPPPPPPPKEEAPPHPEDIPMF